jgi:tetratricopeptide (TPR) repeat protein
MHLLPQDAAWAQMLGKFGAMTGNYTTAVEGYSTAAEVSQFQAEPVDDLLQSYIAAKKYDQAINYVQKTLPEAGRVGVVKARLAQALYLKGDKEKAGPLFTEAVAESAKDYASSLAVTRIAVATLGRTEAADLMQRRMAADPENPVVKYVLVAMYADQKQWDAADKLSSELVPAVKGNDEKALILRQRGALLYQAGKHKEASQAYEELLKAAPDDVDAMNNVAYILAEDLSQPQEGLRYARRAAELRPRDANVIDTLGWAYYLCGDVDSAVGSLVDALQISPNNIAAHYHVALAYKKQGKQDLANRELVFAQKVIEKAPQDPIAQMFQERVKAALKESSSPSGAAGK